VDSGSVDIDTKPRVESKEHTKDREEKRKQSRFRTADPDG